MPGAGSRANEEYGLSIGLLNCINIPSLDIATGELLCDFHQPMLNPGVYTTQRTLCYEATYFNGGVFDQADHCVIPNKLWVSPSYLLKIGLTHLESDLICVAKRLQYMLCHALGEVPRKLILDTKNLLRNAMMQWK